MRNINGILQEEAIPMTLKDRALSKGDILFEKIRVHRDTLLFWEEHYLRLMAAMRRVRMEIPMSFTMEYLEKEIQKTIQANAMEDNSCLAFLAVYRTSGEALLPEKDEVHFCIEVTPLASVFYTLKTTPYKVELYKEYRIGEKHISAITSNNKALQIAGAVFARENGYQNCLLLNHSNMLVSALDANIFLVKGHTVRTPRIEDGCYNGIIRRQLIRMIGDFPDYDIEEVEVSPFELQQCDEVFLTNIRIGIQPITHYRKREFRTDFTARVLEALNNRISN